MLGGLLKKNTTSEKKQIEIDRQLVFSLSRSKFPTFKQLTYLNKFLNRSERRTIMVLISIIVLSSAYLGIKFYRDHVQVVPISGGTYAEGLIGSPKYINPLYATVNDADSDIASLVFSSILKRQEGGNLENDLAEKYEIAPDGKKYAVTIRNGVKWHNNEELTADDIVFTFNAIKDSDYKSPLRASFSGVEIAKIDQNKIEFNLSEPYAGFLELLTFGIIPSAIWGEMPAVSSLLAELNLKPIGSGPYKFKSFNKVKNGNIHSYTLTANDNYYGKVPYIKDITFIFYPSFEEAISALNENSIEGISYMPKDLKPQLISQNSLVFHNLEMPRISSIFFNLNSANKIIADKKVRQAMAFAINKTEIVNNLEGGYYRAINSPIPDNSFAYKKDIKDYAYNAAEAEKLLKEAGWTLAEISDEAVAGAEQKKATGDEKEKAAADKILAMGKGKWLQKNNAYLAIKITTVEKPENVQVTEAIKAYWGQVGIKTDIELVAVSQIQGSIIKPRNFEALFYGVTLGADPDSYVFWHSSQAEKGLNLSGYNNKDADKLLEDGRQTIDVEKRKEIYYKFQDMIAEDEPAIFLYSSVYNYVQSKKLKGFIQQGVYAPSDRFSKIGEWYVKTGKKIIW